MLRGLKRGGISTQDSRVLIHVGTRRPRVQAVLAGSRSLQPAKLRPRALATPASSLGCASLTASCELHGPLGPVDVRSVGPSCESVPDEGGVAVEVLGVDDRL